MNRRSEQFVVSREALGTDGPKEDVHQLFRYKDNVTVDHGNFE